MKKKTTMAVSEMRQLLGLSKVESYWLVHKQYFATIVVGGKMRVVIASFEDWYSRQFHYKKVSGEVPGTKWDELTISIAEAAERMGVCNSWCYEVLKKHHIETIMVGQRKRVVRESLESWLQCQSHYPINKV